jgi:hypothetical protein
MIGSGRRSEVYGCRGAPGKYTARAMMHMGVPYSDGWASMTFDGVLAQGDRPALAPKPRVLSGSEVVSRLG